MQKLQSQSLAESYIALADFFLKLLMVISSFCDPCFTPSLAESLLFPSVLPGYRTLTQNWQVDMCCPRLSEHCAILQHSRVTL